MASRKKARQWLTDNCETPYMPATAHYRFPMISNERVTSTCWRSGMLCQVRALGSICGQRRSQNSVVALLSRQYNATYSTHPQNLGMWGKPDTNCGPCTSATITLWWCPHTLQGGLLEQIKAKLQFRAMVLITCNKSIMRCQARTSMSLWYLPLEMGHGLIHGNATWENRSTVQQMVYWQETEGPQHNNLRQWEELCWIWTQAHLVQHSALVLAHQVLPSNHTTGVAVGNNSPLLFPQDRCSESLHP